MMKMTSDVLRTYSGRR